jgi:hypothetical protein
MVSINLYRNIKSLVSPSIEYGFKRGAVSRGTSMSSQEGLVKKDPPLAVIA